MNQSKLKGKTCDRRQARENKQPAPSTTVPSAGKTSNLCQARENKLPAPSAGKCVLATSRYWYLVLLLNGWKISMFAVIGQNQSKHNYFRQSIGSFRDIKIQLDNEAERTQTKERINMLVQFPLFVSSQPRYQAEF